MLSNAYFLAKFRFDTAENEPDKNLQNFANFPNFANGCGGRGRRGGAVAAVAASHRPVACGVGGGTFEREGSNFRGLVLGCIEAKFCK